MKQQELIKNIAQHYKILADKALTELKELKANKTATPYQIKKQRRRYNSFMAQYLKYNS